MRKLFLIALLSLPICAGCAYIGAVSAAMLLDDDEDEDARNTPPTASSPSAVAISPLAHVTLQYLLHDADSDPADVLVEYSTDGGANFFPCTELSGSQSEGITGLAAGPQWPSHLYVWDAPTDLTGYNVIVIVRISPTDTLTGIPGSPHTFPGFTWRANAGPVASVQAPGNPSGNVSITYSLSDPEGNPTDVAIEFSTDGGLNFSAASPVGYNLSEGITSLLASAAGDTHQFIWNSFPDVGGGDASVILRVTPTDAVSGTAGTAGLTSAFTVMNSRVNTVAGRSTHAFGPAVGVASDGAGVLYFSERYGHRIYGLNTSSTARQAAGITLNPGQLKALAGTGLAGYNGDFITASTAKIDNPGGLALDLASPPNLYFADTGNHRVRRIDGATGFISTLTGDGTPGITDALPANQCRVNGPEDVAVGPFGNVFIADTGNNVIRVVNLGPDNLALGGSVVVPQRILSICGAFPPNPLYGGDGGPAPSALLNGPAGIAFDGAGHLYIADTGNQRVRAVNTKNPASGTQTATFGNVSIDAGDIDTVAGTGNQGYGGDSGNAVGPTVLLDAPRGLHILSGNLLLFGEGQNHVVRAVHLGAGTSQPITLGSVTLQPGWIDTIAGSGPSSRGFSGDGGDSTVAQLDSPWGVTGLSGSVVVADSGNRRLRAINPLPLAGSASITLAGVSMDPGEIDSIQSSPGFPIHGPSACVYRSNVVYSADTVGHRVIALDTLDGSATAIAGNGSSGFSGDSGPALSASFSGPSGVAFDVLSGKVVLVSDWGNHRIRAVHFDTVTGGPVTAFGVTINAGEVETLTSVLGQLTFPAGLATDGNGNLYIADTGGNRIVKVDRNGGAWSVVAGTGNPGGTDGNRTTTAEFLSPEGLTISSVGLLYVADTGNHTLRLVNLGPTTVFYGSGPSLISVAPDDVGRIGGTVLTPGWDGEGREAWLSLLNAPVGIWADSFGNVTFTERGNHRVRRILAASGTLMALAGGGIAGFNGDGGLPGQTLFDSPEGLTTNGAGDYFIADRNNGRIRRFRAP